MSTFDKVLPKDWKWVTLEEIRESNQKAIVSGPFGSNIGRKFFVEFGVPVIRGNNLTIGAERFIDDGFVFITEKKAKEFSNCEAVSGDLIFTAAGTLGQVGLIPEKTKYPKYIISNKQMRARVDPKVANKLFVFYWLSSPEMVEYIEQRNTGSSVPLINLSILRNLPIPLPPHPTQRRIAEILGRLDDKIEVNRRINRTLEAMAQALFKHWFVDFGPFQDGEFVESELGLIPKGWRVAPLPEAIAVNPSRTLAKGQIAPYLEMSNMPTNSSRALDWYDRPLNSGMKFINGDVLVARITPCLEHGKTAFVDFLEDGQVGWGSTEYIVLRSKPPLPLEYSYLLARSEDFRSFAIQRMTGTSGRQRVSADSFYSYQVIIPSQEVAEQFGKTARRIFEMIKCFDGENRALAATRDYLLPKLLSGEITV